MFHACVFLSIIVTKRKSKCDICAAIPSLPFMHSFHRTHETKARYRFVQDIVIGMALKVLSPLPPRDTSSPLRISVLEQQMPSHFPSPGKLKKEVR
jgi:hypothetical protein